MSPAKQPLTLKDFTAAFGKLKAKGWVRSERQGSTGIGYTLEKMLGLTENNLATPDMGEIELKAHRYNSDSLITLFTFDRKVWQLKPIEAIKKYGSPDLNGRLGLYYTISPTPNRAGLFLHSEPETISVRHLSQEILAEWQLLSLTERFIQKIPTLLFVSAFSEMRGDEEWFKFDRAQLLAQTSPEIFRTQILTGKVLVDLRLHAKTTSARNHGTGFRILEGQLPTLFQTRQDLGG